MNDRKNSANQKNAENARGIAPKLPIWLSVFLAVIAFGIIIGAFVIEARSNRETIDEDEYVPRSLIQAELQELDWVEQMFLDINPFSRPGTSLDEVNGIVIHNIGNPNTTALQNRNYFNNLQHRQNRFASSHFIVCLDGSIIQCMPVDEVAYASNFRNYDTLSIEVTHPDDTGRFTDESYDATVRLTAWLCLRYNLTSADVIRHHDIPGIVTDCPRYFVNNPGAWDRFLQDVESEMERQTQ